MTKVLIVEDNAAVRDSIVLELEMNGYEVLDAGDGEEALRVLAEANTLPQIIVSDIAMPRMDGYTFLENVQQHEKWHYIPFIFLTALDSEHQVRLGKSMGVDDYLVKPFKTEDLIVAIENKLRRVADFEQRAERQLDTVRSELMNLISHELNTPLTAIYGGTEMLAESLAALPDELTQHTLQIIQRGTWRMKRLVEQVVMMAQLDSGVLAKHFAEYAMPFELALLIEHAHAALSQEFPPEKYTINTKFPPDAVMVSGLEDVIQRSISEVMRNALTYSKAPVDVELMVEGDKAYVVVRDTGIGIATESHELVWERFRQVNRAVLEQQGTGLGLSLVRSCVRLHGGEAYLESAPGMGTVVTLELPLYTV